MALAVFEEALDATKQVLFKIGEPFLGMLPALLTLFIVGLVGWLVGRVSQRVASSLMSHLKLDAWLLEHDASTPFSHYSVSAMLAESLHWLVFALFVQQAIDVASLGALQPFFAWAIALVPSIVMAFWTVLLAIVVGRLLKNTIEHLDYPYRNALGQSAEILCLLAGVLSALYQLRVDATLLRNATLILFAGSALALAIGVGLRFGLHHPNGTSFEKNAQSLFADKTKNDHHARANRAP